MNIVILDAATLAQASFDLFQGHSITRHEHTTPEQVLSRIQGAEVLITNKVELTASILKQASQLKLILIAATGTNNVDLNAARNLNIAVCNVSGYSTPAVVQHTFGLIINLYSRMQNYIADVNGGAWQKSRMFCLLDHPLTELYGKTLAIIGYGELGKGVEKVALAFGMNVMLAERKGATTIRNNRVSFEDALKIADIVSVHCPLTELTADSISTSEFEKMKTSAILINTARGGVVDEKALITALENGTIAAAGVDVLQNEPAKEDNPLIRYLDRAQSNLIVTPHIAWATSESIQRLVNEMAYNLNAFCNAEQRNRIV